MECRFLSLPGSILGLVVTLLPIASSAQPPNGKPVTVQPLGELIFFPRQEAPATAVSLNDTRLSAEVAGRIDHIPVQVGDNVSQDDVVAELDCDDHEIGLAQAEAEYKAAAARDKFARSQLKNAKKLSKTRNIAKEQLNQRLSEAAASEAEAERLRSVLSAAERKVSKCSIGAPFNAVIIERLASIGDYVVPGTPVIRLLDQDEIEISARVQDQDLADLKTARELHFVTRRKAFPVKLRKILPLMDSRIRSYEARLTFRTEKATPGTAGRLAWRLDRGYIPAEFLVRRGDGLGIFINESGLARFIALKGARFGQPAAVKLSPATKVIVKGRFGLQENDRLAISKP